MFKNFSLLRENKTFRFLYLSQSISLFGTMITRVALPFQIYEQTHSTLMVGLLSLAQLAPLLLTALLGGAVADRYRRRRLVMGSELFLVGISLLLILNATVTHPHVWVLFALSALASAVTGLHRPAMTGMTQQIVLPSQYARMSTLNNFMYSFAAIAGPAVAGLLIAHLGLVVTYSVDFITFVISLYFLWCMGDVPHVAQTKDESIWQSLKGGLKFAYSRQELMGSYYVDFIAMIFGMPIALFPAMAYRFGGPQVLGLMYSAMAVGSLVPSFFSRYYETIKRYGVAISIAAVLWGFAIIGFGLSHDFYWSLFFLALAGGFDSVSAIFRGILWNHAIPNEYRSRLAGVEMISYLGGPKLGDTESGLVAAAFGITASVVSGGILCVAGVIICCALMPKFWHYRGPGEKA